MNVLSLFDGMSGGQLALQKVGLKVDKYYSCEIDEYAQSVTRFNFPNTVFLGDVTKVDFSKLKDIDLVIGGSPCQDLSFAKGNGKGLEGSRSSLFYKFVEAIEVCKPEYFFLENVKMKQEWKDIISDLLGVQPIFINSADFSAQNRQRLYWTNIPVAPWTPCKTKLQDILETGQVDRDKSHCLDANYFKGGNLKSYFEKHRRQLVFNRCIQVGEANIKGRESIRRVYSPEGKSPTLTTCGGGHREPKIVVKLDKHSSSVGLKCVGALTTTKKWLDNGKNLQRNFSQGERIYSDEGKSPTLSAHSGGTAGVGNALITDDIETLRWRKLTPIEAERLQTVPDNYTSKGVRELKEVKISNTQRYKMLGNGWTINVIAHIFESLRKGAV